MNRREPRFLLLLLASLGKSLLRCYSAPSLCKHHLLLCHTPLHSCHQSTQLSFEIQLKTHFYNKIYLNNPQYSNCFFFYSPFLQDLDSQLLFTVYCHKILVSEHFKNFKLILFYQMTQFINAVTKFKTKILHFLIYIPPYFHIICIHGYILYNLR